MTLCFSLVLLSIAFADEPEKTLDSVKAEKDVTKRYMLALDLADDSVTEARKFQQEGQPESFQKSLNVVGQAVQLCNETLYATGKNPSRSPKHFKRAELKIRAIIRRLVGLEQEVGFEDRPPIESVKSKVQRVHDELLFDIMGRR